MSKKRSKRKTIEPKKGQARRLLYLSFILTTLGILAVADASAPLALSTFSDKFYYAKQQLVWGLLGIVLLIVFSNVNFKIWKKIAGPLFILSVFGLILVLFPGFGIKVLGARRWLSLGLFSFQPSEFVKLPLAIYLAKTLSLQKKLIHYFLPIILVAFLVMLQPDLGTTIVIVIMGASQIFISGVNALYLAFAGILGLVITLLTILVSDYRRERLVTFLNETQDPLGKGYHIRQILFSLGSGGLLGVGLGQSRQKHLFLPEAATDSIFAVIAEELGFVGAGILIILFILFILSGLKIAHKATDSFAKVLAVGIVSWIGGQAFVNIASMLSLVPLTGIPLPFISYGGSSLTSVLLASGILINISKRDG